MTVEDTPGNKHRGLTTPRNLHDWENDPEYRAAVREAKEVGAMVPNVLDWAQFKAEEARAKR